MMTIVVVVASILAVLLAVVLVRMVRQPDTFRVQRTVPINAPPEKLYPLINNYDNWPAWSPYEKLDPAMKRNRSGAPAGKGAIYEWEGNKNVGHGRMEILDETPHSKIVIKLDFFSPFKANNIAEFTMQPAGAGATDVTWAMYGPSTFTSKLMRSIFNIDRMVGGQFEEGLTNMKAVAESR
jgi:uncharacterized protein YndB with AHSA1/START domain